MEIKKAKTKLDKLKEIGLEINLCKVTIVPFKPKGSKVKFDWVSKSIEIVYKKIKVNHNDDKYLTSRIRERLNIKDTQQFKIKSVETIKSLGYGVYEN